MKLFVALAFSIMALNTAFSQQTPVKIVADKLEVEFPAKPEETANKQGGKSYRLRLADSSANFALVAVNLESTGVTAEQYEEYSKTDEFWEQVVTGMLRSLENTTVIRKEKKEFKGLTALWVELERKIDGKTDTIYQWIFIKGVMNYTAVFTSRNGKGDLKLRDAYFNSIRFLE